MAGEINEFAHTMTELIDSLGELAAGSREVTDTLIQLREHAEAIKTGYHNIMDKAHEFEASIQSIPKMDETGRP
jgi:methyl-accepting chemotaxis protein